ncbi:DNA cross-link repair 1A protein [Armadillidium nasatum]|uniref:DNA cross-link repair 1A protein n=1 Tax=Armadillidium nasatum TaxID=96803 RepID=A0A5N5TK26_9CRUS|nr:DNA cross-link repair 1A protein [Armadillidium nasatum]
MFTKNTLFVVGSYTIGKEKVFKAIASKLNCRIYAQPYKERILRCLNDPEINNRLTKDKIRAQVHVIGMRDMSLCKLKKYMEEMQNTFKALVAIRPTGWEHNSDVERNLLKLKPKQTGNIYVYGLPYSEHSSYSELRRFYQFIQPSRTIPTVYNGKESRLKMEKFFKEWKLQSVSAFSKS